MRPWILVALVMIATAQNRDPRARFIGTWSLVSYMMTSATGEVSMPLGEKPMGRIAYTPGGQMSAQLSAQNRRRPASDDRTIQPEAEQAAAYVSYNAYFGEYEVRPAENLVVHKVAGALNPAWVGTELRRKYRFEDNDRRMVLEAEINWRGKSHHGVLTWRRLE